MLLKVDGKAEHELDQWTPTAASAALASKFLNQSGSDAADALEAFRIFNDMLATRQYFKVQEELDALDKLPAAEKNRSHVKQSVKELQVRREALRANIQDETIKNLLPEV